MKRTVVAALAVIMTACAEMSVCALDEVEREVRDLLETVMDLRARQDPGFAKFYDDDEYSFPGEAWVFRGRDRATERGRAIQAARAEGSTWKMEIRELHVKASHEMAWVAGFVHAERLDPVGKTTHTADWRLTAVLERRPEGWRIVHQHSSVPIGDPRQWWKRVPSAE